MEPPTKRPALSVSVRFSFFILAGLLAYGRMSEPLLLVEWLVVVAFSVMAHELGHALAYRWYGHGSHITLHGMGGLTQSTGGPALSHLQSAFVSVAGPLAGFGVALLAAGASYALPRFLDWKIPDRLLLDLLWVNVGWSVINLFPIVPMDGGHIMQSVLRHRLGDRAEVPALAISLTVALAAGAAAFYAGWTWSLIMVIWFGASNAQTLFELRRQKRLEGVRAIMRGAVEAYYARDFYRAGTLALSAMEQTKDEEAAAQLRDFVAAVEQAVVSGASTTGAGDLDALRRRPEWTAAVAMAQAAKAHDPTQIFT